MHKGNCGWLDVHSNEWRQAEVLAVLAPHLTGERRTLALEHALEIAPDLSDAGQRARVLTILAPHLAAKQRTLALASAMEAVLALPDDSGRTEILTLLVVSTTIPKPCSRPVFRRRGLHCSYFLIPDRWDYRIVCHRDL